MTLVQSERGERNLIREKDGVSVVRVCLGHAYPKSGNAHNPTPRFAFWAMQGGRVIDRSARLSDLAEYAKGGR